MKILVFTHSGNSGGAELALRNLIDLLKIRHEVHVVLSSLQSHEANYYLKLGVKCIEMTLPFNFCLPETSAALLGINNINWESIIDVLGENKYNLVISNTLVILHGNIIAEKLKLPHITYVHEYLEDRELLPLVIDKNTYLNFIGNGSSGIMACSNAVMKQFEKINGPKKIMFPPYDFPLPNNRDYDAASDEFVIQVIGTESHRKNIGFAADVVKSLNLLGHKVRLDIIGGENSASRFLGHHLNNRGIKYRRLPRSSNPFEINARNKVITLSCAITEPYGLTVVESLMFGIPVIAANSGGPDEILSDEYLYEVNNLDGCVRKILAIINDYDGAIIKSCAYYNKIRLNHHEKHNSDLLELYLGDVCSNNENSQSDLQSYVDVVHSVAGKSLSLYDIWRSLRSVVFDDEWHKVDFERFNQMIEEERKFPGKSVLSDIHKFNVVPFAMSDSMDSLYRKGVGLAVELAATYSDLARVNMASFIACNLLQEQKMKRKKLSILALGDGIGVDSIRLSQAGFEVDYIDYDHSVMGLIAAENFKISRIKTGKAPLVIKELMGKYDAIVCLEVIEHVDDPDEFISLLRGHLYDDGLIYISECFNGIQNRWPTHLASNEKYAGLLPLMMARDFVLEAYNTNPFGKPYVFRLSSEAVSHNIRKLLNDRNILAHLVHQRINLGFY